MERSFRRLTWIFLVLFVLSDRQAFAQTDCQWATLALESNEMVDSAAVCDAAQPLREAGFDVLVYLTDFAPATEDEWFDHLDEVEIANGLRDPAGFELSGIALEISTADAVRWVSVTTGERLIGTSLDTDDGIEEIKSVIQNRILVGETTEGLVEALQLTHDLADIEIDADPVTADNTVTESAAPPSDSNASAIALGVLAVGAVGAGGYYAYPRYIAPAVARRRRRAELEAHLMLLQERVANLLLGCEQLLDGSLPQETILYQIFDSYGGPRYAKLDANVTEWLRRSQDGLNDAFAVRSRLLDAVVQEQRGLEQLVEDWERIYVTLVGTQEDIVNLSDAELRILLDPLEVLEKRPDSNSLSTQLDVIAKEIEGLPLKVDLQLVDTSELDAEGVLGYVDGVQGEIGRLQHAQSTSPKRLEAVNRERLQLEEEIPRPFGLAKDPFVIAEEELFIGADKQFQAATGYLQQGLFLRVLDECDAIEADFDIIRELVAVVEQWQKRQDEWDGVLAEGFRPKTFATDHAEIEENITNIRQALGEGDYGSVAVWIDELDNDSERTLAHVNAWRDLHQTNTEKITTYRQRLGDLDRQRATITQSAWDVLTLYPRGNWEEVAPYWEESEQLIATAPERIQQATDLNALKTQKLDDAEHLLARIFADLAITESHLQEVEHRLAEVQSAETNIDTALTNAKMTLDHATAFRDKEDEKITPQVDQWLTEAAEQLEEARNARSQRNYIAAIRAQTTSEELATTAYKSADEQVAHINNLLSRLQSLIMFADDKADYTLRQANKMEAVMVTAEVSTQTTQLQQAVSEARQHHAQAVGQEDVALAASLQEAVKAFEAAQTQVTALRQTIDTATNGYNSLFNEAKGKYDEAKRALSSATRKGKSADAGQKWRTFHDRAERKLPDRPSNGDTREALQRKLEKAREALSDAQHAEKVASAAISEAQKRRMRRRMQHTRPSHSWGSGGWSSGSSRSRSSSRSSRSSGSSSRRSSFGSSSRRSSRGRSRRR